MKRVLGIGAFLCLLTAPVVAQSSAPVPRPSGEERALLAEERAATAEVLEGVEMPAIAEVARDLTSEERASVSAQIGPCWNVGSATSGAATVAVVVGFDMAEDGRPIVDSLEMVDAATEDATLAEEAFQAARRAIIRCAGDGYDLPAAAYAQWQRMELTFDPNQAGGQ